MKFFININYNDKDKAKQKGFKWDNYEKKWYLELTNINNYRKYFNLISEFDSNFVIVKDLYLFRTMKKCYRCNNETYIYLLGAKNYCDYVFDDEFCGTDLLLERNEDFVYLDLWDSHLLNFIDKDLKENFNMYKDIAKQSKICCIANHCKHCKSLQGVTHTMDNVKIENIEYVKHYALRDLLSIKALINDRYMF